MTNLGALILAASLAAACAAPGGPTPLPTPSASPAPATSTPVPLPTPSASPAPATSTPAPSPSATPSYLFRDDFEGALADGWQWLGEDVSGWSLTDAPGFLRILVRPSSIGADDPINFAVRPVPTGDFVLETFMRFEPAQNFEFAGLLIYDQQGNAMQFGRAFAIGCGEQCIGNGLYFEGVVNGERARSNHATRVDQADADYLRVVRVGNEYAAYYSIDGISWTRVGRHEGAIGPRFVGLIASQGPAGARAADFDYFMISRPTE
jgi:hypothetical protein